MSKEEGNNEYSMKRLKIQLSKRTSCTVLRDTLNKEEITGKDESNIKTKLQR